MTRTHGTPLRIVPERRFPRNCSRARLHLVVWPDGITFSDWIDGWRGCRATLCVMQDVPYPTVGDPAELVRHVYRDHVDRVYGYLVYRLAGRRAEAEELTQDVFVAFVGAVRSGVTVDDPQSWLITVARNKLVDHLRRVTRQIRPEPVSSTDDTDLVESALMVARMLEVLPVAQRAAMTLRYVDDLPVAEVAAVLGRSVRATESLLSRARRTLAKELT